MVVAGFGVQRLRLSEVAEDIVANRFLHVLPEWSLPTLDVFAAWPASLIASTCCS